MATNSKKLIDDVKSLYLNRANMVYEQYQKEEKCFCDHLETMRVLKRITDVNRMITTPDELIAKINEWVIEGNSLFSDILSIKSLKGEERINSTLESIILQNKESGIFDEVAISFSKMRLDRKGVEYIKE